MIKNLDELRESLNLFFDGNLHTYVRRNTQCRADLIVGKNFIEICAEAGEIKVTHHLPFPLTRSQFFAALEDLDEQVNEAEVGE